MGRDPRFADEPGNWVDQLVAFGIMLAIGLLMAAVLFLSGCAPMPHQVSVPAGTALAKASAMVDAAKPLMLPGGRPLLDKASGYLVEADAGTLALLVERDAIQEELRERNRQYEEFKGRWYIRLAVVAHRIAMGILIGWMVLQVYSIFATAFGGGWIFAAGRFLINLLPFSNVSSTISRKLQKARKK